MKHGGVLPIYFDWIISALLAAWIGFAQPRSWRYAAGLSVAVAIIAWLFTYPLIAWGTDFGGDTAIAEDYLNGIGDVRAMGTSLAHMSVWTFVWFVLGSLTRLLARRTLGNAHLS